MNYIPSPKDLSDVTLDASLAELIETLAAEVHETWAKERYDSGWRYGEKRDDVKKEHPCLIPFEQLPESEKVYDRNTAIATIKLIQTLGYCITKR